MILDSIIRFFIPVSLIRMIQVNEYFRTLQKESLLNDVKYAINTGRWINDTTLKQAIIYGYNLGINDSDILTILKESHIIYSTNVYDFESISIRKMQCFVTGKKFVY